MQANYTIHHFDLSQGVPQPVTGAGPAYCVFWYRTIPLGDCYLSAAEMGTPESLEASCRNSIWPAVRHYTTGRESLPAKAPGIEELISLCRSFEADDPDTIPLQSVDVSVVICTRNRPTTLWNCLTALRQQVCRPLEVIVVDNASSTDETRKTVSEFDFARYVYEGRKGLDIARNTGVREARGNVVAFTDDDTVPDPHWVYRVASTFRADDVHAMTGLVLAGSLRTEAEVIFEKYWPFNRGYLPRTFDRHFFNATLSAGPPVWEIGAGANMAFRKSMFEDVGYFDERLDVGAAGCSGDSEIWYRILANGFRIVYNPLAVVTHLHRTSMDGLKKQLHAYMKGFTVAILIQYQRFGHRGNLHHLFGVLPAYYLGLLYKGFPGYHAQYRTLFREMTGVLAGLVYFFRHRRTNSRIYYGNDSF